MQVERHDVILAGAGLANALIALRLKASRPELRILALDSAPAAANTHTWSFFSTDVAPSRLAWLQPLIRRSWAHYDVGFPGLKRTIDTAYNSVEECTLQRALAAALGPHLRRNAPVAAIDAAGVTLAGGERIEAPLVIDGRGALASPALWLAWQKFCGVELRLKRPHGLSAPVLMDAEVPQLDGYRFLYVLPFDDRTVLVEDTRYSASARFDPVTVEAEAIRYARANGWSQSEVVRREVGVLPIALGGDIDQFWADQPSEAPAVGLRAALFHPTTGYSLPDAAETADLIAAAPKLVSGAIRTLVEDHSKRRWRERSFYRALNRMMFLAADDAERWRVLAHFYRMPRPVIERFYGARTTVADRVRLLAGRPPVPVGRALSALVAQQTAERVAP